MVPTRPTPGEVFQAEDGRWGARDANGSVEIQPIYRRIDDHHYQLGEDTVVLTNDDEVLADITDDWELLAFHLI